jgi:PKD repeat protein
MDQPKEAGVPSVAMDGQGDAIAIWAWEFGGPVIQTAFKPGGGAWQEPVDLSTFGEDATNPDIACDSQGDAIAVWNVKSATGGPEIIQSAYKPAGSVWQAPTDLSGADNSGYEPLVAFDGQGDAVAAWAGENGSIQSAGYVAAGPQLNDVSIPTSGVVGQPVTFSVSPFDVWSIAGESGWSFGDGASASGASVTHIYTAPGTYEVTIQSADTLGNVTSTAGKITIAPAVTSAPSPSEPSSGPPTSTSVWRERGKSRIGTTFSLSLNEQASVSLSFMRDVNGRMVGRKCLATTPSNAGHRVCSRTVITGVLSFAGHSGMNTFSFQGLVSHSRKLLPGRYTVVITATNVAGRRSSPSSLSFTIVE